MITFKVYLISGLPCTTGAGVTFDNGATSSVGFAEEKIRGENKPREMVNTVRTALRVYTIKEQLY